MKNLNRFVNGYNLSVTHFFKINSLILLLLLVYSGSISSQCTTCTNNIITNPGFDANVNGWNAWNGNFYSSASYPQCGTPMHAEYLKTSGTNGGFIQDIAVGTGGLTNGTSFTLSFWAGVHDNTANTYFGLEYFSGSTYHSSSVVQIDKILGGTPSMQYYTINSVVPAGVTTVRVVGSMDFGYLKVDEVCLQVASSSTSNRSCTLANISLCDGSANSSGPYLDFRFDGGGSNPSYSVISGTFTEYSNGTASIVALLQNTANSNIRFNLNATLSGKNTTGPAHFNTNGNECTTSPKSDWYYYSGMTGSLTGVSGTWTQGAYITILGPSMGSPVQIGTGAAFYSTTALQMSTWFDVSITTQPNTGHYISNGGVGTDLYFDIKNCSATTCDPNNASAPPYCAPTPTCAAGNILWTQAVNSTDGSTPLRMYCGSTTTFTLPITIPNNYKTGAQTVNISDVVSYDGYSGRNTVTQPNEKWRLIFKKGGVATAVSGYTGDVPDLKTQGYWRGSLGTVTVPDGFDEVVIEHWSVSQDCNSPNSVAPVSICFSSSPTTTTCNSTPLSLCSPNILKVYNLTEVGLTCENPQRNLPLVLFIGNTNYQVKPGTSARLIEYTDGTVKASMQLVKNLGTLGNVDLNVGYNVELTGSQKTTGTPASPFTPAVGCAPNTNNWTFYNTFELKLCGTGSNVGSNFNIINPQQANWHPLQIGTGANALNTSLGGGIWFGTVVGDFVFKLSEIPVTLLAVNAGSDIFRCGQSAPLTATASGGSAPYTYAWSDGLANGAARNIGGTYTVTVTDANGCTATDQVILTINPQLTLTMPDIAVCSGPNFLVTASASGGTPAYTYTWSGGLGTGNSKSLSTTNATYTVTVTDSKGCTASDPFTVTVGSVSAAISGITNICNGGSTTLTASGGGSYVWSTGSTAAAITVSPATNTTYTVTVTVGECSNSATSTVTVNPSATATITGPAEICSGSSGTLTASGGGSYAWNTGSTAAAITVSPTTSTTYTVTVTNTSGCKAVGTKPVAVNPKPTAGITATGNNCITANAQLFGSATGGTPTYTYGWTGPNGFTSSQQNPYITVNGTYVLTVRDSKGCTDTKSIVIFTEFIPVIVTVGTDICAGESVTLTAQGGGTYKWGANANNATSNAVTVTPASTQSYTVTVTSTNGCVATASVTITVYSKPVISNVSVVQNSSCNNIGNTGSITVTATGQAGLTLQYRINGGTWQTSNVFNNLGNGSYNVEVSYTQRLCTSAPTPVTISSQSGITVNAGIDKSVCPGTSFTLSATASGGTAPYSYSWPGGLSGNPVTVSGITSATNYTVTVTDGKGCTATDVVSVSVHALPSASITKEGDLTCIRTSSKLTALPGTGMNYLWSVGNQTTQMITVTTAGTYTVTVTNQSTGCNSSATITVTSNTTAPNANAGNDKVLTCSTTSVTLDGSSTTAGARFSWVASNGGFIVSGATTATPLVNAAGTYTLTVTDPANGCTSSDAMVVTLNRTPPAGVSADNIGGPLTCIDNSVTIRAFPIINTYNYAWTGPGGYTATSRENNVGIAGTYNVTVTDTQNGCSSAASTTVLQDVNVPVASAGPDKTICNGTSTTLTASGGGTYLWFTGQTTPTITVSPSITTTYTVTVTGSNGCSAVASAKVTVTPLPSSGITGPLEICVDEYAVFNASPALTGATYAWTFGGGTSLDGDANDVTESIKWSSAFENTSRTVTLVVTVNGCPSSYTKDILVKTGPYLNTQDKYPVCQGGTVKIGPNPNDPAQVNPGATFQWTPNLFLNSATVAQPLSTPPFDITYTLTATLNGCAVSKQITVDVNVNLNPIADAGLDKSVCITESVQVGGSPTATAPPAGGATISGVLWTIPPSGTITSTQSNPMVSPSTNTVYQVVVVASNGCTDTDQVSVTVTPKMKIGDYTWIDSNGNGCQDAGEVGINGVSVSLYTGGGVLVTSTTTANNATTGLAGYYQFDVCPGTYYVNFGKPAGYSYTGEKVCGGTGTDSDANVTSGNTMSFTIVSGQNNLTIDAGYKPLGNIRGTVLADTNNDNVGDTPLANVTIQLKDPTGVVVATTTTNGSGQYEFLNVLAGDYTIMQVQPTGYNSVSDVDTTPDPDGNDGTTPNNMIPVTVSPGENDNENTFVEEQPGTISGTVLADTNNDNVGDTPLANVTIQLKDQSGNVVATTTTNGSGQYTFTNVAPGNYTIMQVQPTGYNSVSDVDGTPDPDGNDGTTPNDMIPVSVTSGENDVDNNFVEEQPGTISGTVLADTDNNNVGDTPLANVTIQLKDAVTNAVVATTTTNGSGQYTFTNVAPGNYTIMEVQPTGYNSVSDVDATPDPDGNDGTTPNNMIPVSVTPGENDNDNNFVEEQPGTISGTVLADTNNDNTGDTPLANVTIQLKDPVTGVVVATTTTNGSGQYTFTNVAPGNYTIMQVQPTGYNSVSDVDGTPDPDGNDGTTPNDMIPVSVTSGENDNDNNFVEEQPATISGTVYADTNNDNTGDTPLANVTIQLKDAVTNVVVATTTTNGSGQYTFTNVAPGNYTIMEVQPTGYNSVSDVDATPDPDGNDGTTPNNMIPVSVTSGENDNDNNFVEEQPGTISGTVLADTNNDNTGDTPLANVTVQLKDAVTNAVVATTTTNNSGQYTFTNVAPGSYVVMETQPTGYNSVSDGDASPDTDPTDASPNDMIPVNIVAGENDGDNNFVEEQPGNIRGNVKADTNNDNIGDSAISGVTIQLKDATTNVVVATTTTDGLGNYAFLNIAPGNYTIMEVQPTGYNSVSDADATPDPDGADGTTPNEMIPVVLTSGENDNDNNFVEEQPGTISGTVLADTDNNNIGDTPLANVTVQLKDLSGNVVATTTTNGSGQYTFTNVSPGSYVVMEVQPTGYESVSDGDATPDTDPTDASPNDMIPVNVLPGESDGDNNFVEEQLGNIRGNVKADTNNDNVGDVALANVSLQLKNPSTGAVIATTTTDNLGNYAFLNIAPGNYTIMEVQPTGYNSVSDVDATPDPDGNDGVTTNDMIPVVLTAGENDNDNNFVEEQTSSISGTVTADTDNNNIGDAPLANVTVQLKDAVTNAVVATTTTNGSGQYTFTNVAPGSYIVMETQPTGYNSVSDGDASADSDPTDASPNDMIPVNIVAGENDTDNNFVEEQQASISGTVLKDTDNNNTGDQAMANVTLQLKDAVTGVVVATTTTNTSGQYTFANVAPGNYVVMETQPTGYNSVSDGDASPDTDPTDASPNDMIPVNIVAGENDTDNNFVEEQQASISGTVLKDTDNNNTGDQAMANVTLQLKDAVTGVVVATTTTNTSGQYTFANVAPGNYVVMETQPTGYNSVSDGDASPDTDPTDASPNDMIPVSVVAGENDTDNNFVEEQQASISGTVLKDIDNNNTGDQAMANVTLQLKDAVTGVVVATTTTNTSGQYTFANVAPGNYVVMETQPTGYNSVSDGDASPDTDPTDASPNDMIPVSVVAGENDTDNNFVEEQQASISGTVTADTNNDNIGDTPLANVTVQLKDLSGNVVATQVTNNSGQYTFANVAPGNYVVMETQPTGYNSVSDGDASPDTDPTDASPNDMIPVSVVAGENDTDNNFVEQNLVSLGNFVWEDLNANGLQETGEPGIANVVVRLFNSAGTQIAFKVTDQNGYYEFTGLAPGTYTVKFDKPTGYEATGIDKGGDAVDSDANVVTGVTAPITLVGGQNNLTIDAGFYRLARIGDLVWEDKNANGIQDAFELGIANVLVTLTGTDALGRAVNLTTRTDGNGLYEFTGLTPGSYTVTFTKPASVYKASPMDTPADDAKDSDANVTTGQTGVITLRSGDNNQTIDAGYYRCAYVGDYVWLDQGSVLDRQDGGDIGINGVLVELYSTTNPTTPIQSMLTITNPNDGTKKGYYNFEVCALGNYYIKVKADMNLYNWVQPNQGLDDAIDSDVIDFPNQTTLIFTVTYAAEIRDIDAGLKFRALPVSMKEFRGRWNKGRDVNELRWETLSEINNAYFEVERSYKGSAWASIGQVAGQGNSHVEQSYEIDDSDIRSNGIYSYRLRQVDYDGKETYYGPIEVQVEREVAVRATIYPNPTVGQVNIEIGASEGQKVRADIYDNTGKLVKASVIEGVSDGKDMSARIEQGQLGKGVYYIMLNVDGVITSHKLIVIE